MSHIFLTGGTGVIGSALIPHLLLRPDVRLTVLMRAESGEHLEQRARELLGFCNVIKADEVERICFVKGDVHCEKLGLTRREYGELQQTATGIIHSAGNVKLNQTIENARRNAVEPVQEILKLARSSDRLRKVDAVSTIGVAGRMAGGIPERRLTELRKFHNNYERAKAEAEELLWQAIDDGLPITIHRPSMVVGDSQTGRIIQFQVFYHLCDFLLGARSNGFLPKMEQKQLDIVPLDYVAAAIAICSDDLQSSGHVFHLCTGNQDNLQIQSIVKQVRSRKSQIMDLPQLRWVSPRLFRWMASAYSYLASAADKRAFRAVPHLLDYLTSDQDFETQISKAYFESHGLTMPIPARYLPQVFEYRELVCRGKDVNPIRVSATTATQL